MAQFYQVVNGNATFTIEELRAMYPNLQSVQCIDGGNASIQYIINQDDAAVQYHNQVIGIDQTGATVQLETYQHPPVVLDSSMTQQGVFVIEAVDPSPQVAVDLQEQQVITSQHSSPQFVVQQLQTQLSSPTPTPQTQISSQQHSQIQQSVEGQQNIVYARPPGGNGIALLDTTMQLTGAARLIAEPESSLQKTQETAELVPSTGSYSNVAKFPNHHVGQKTHTQLITHVNQLQGSVLQLPNGQKITLSDWQQLQQQQLQAHQGKLQPQQQIDKQQLHQQQLLHNEEQHREHQCSPQPQLKQSPEQTSLHLQQPTHLQQQQQTGSTQLMQHPVQQIQLQMHSQQILSSPQQTSQRHQQQQLQSQIHQQIQHQEQLQLQQQQLQQIEQRQLEQKIEHQQQQNQQQSLQEQTQHQQFQGKSNNNQQHVLLSMTNSQQNNSQLTANSVCAKRNDRSGVITISCQNAEASSVSVSPIVRPRTSQQQRKSQIQQPVRRLQQTVSQQTANSQQPSQQYSHIEQNSELMVLQPSPRPGRQFSSPRRTYASKRSRGHNTLVANNTVQAIASPTGEHQNLLQQHDNVISVGDQKNKVTQPSPDKEVQQVSPRNTQVVLLLPNGEQRIINVDDGVRSLKNLLGNIGVNVDSNVILSNEYQISCEQNAKEIIKKDIVVDLQYQDQSLFTGKSLPSLLVQKNAANPQALDGAKIIQEHHIDQKAIPPELPKYVDGMFAVCHNCGYSSIDFNRCQRCKKKLPETVKSIAAADTVKKKTTPRKEKCTKLMLKVEPEGVKIPRRNRSVKRTRKLVEEPVILTLSSDDEDHRHNDSEPSVDKSLPNNHCSSSENSNFGSVDNSVTSSAMDKEPIISCQEEHSVSVGDEPDREKGNEMELNVEAIIDGSLAGQYTLLQCRTVRIGSYKVVPTERVILSSVGMRICVPAIDDDSKAVTLSLDIRDVVKVLIHFGRGMPVLFFYAQSAAAAKIRNALKMESKNGPYYDPTSQDDTQKRITLLPERLQEESKAILKGIFNSRNVMEELNNKEANDILVRASPKEVQNMVKKAVGFSPQKTTNTEIHTILVYPPHPGKGGIPINTEDYACLGEDQFLNDVIIDFYLRYLTLSVLSEPDQQRTHVFSSFFYKRLTTRPVKSARRSHPVEDDPKLSPAEKRHSRVKSWTKNVNLFEKDFVVIPINEHCHWFLAIICFPGLLGPVQMCDNAPVSEPVNRKCTKPSKKKVPGIAELESPLKSVQIGCTTITPVKCTDTITLETCDDGSDRDEAEGEDEDMDHSSTDEEEGVCQSDEDNVSKSKVPNEGSQTETVMKGKLPKPALEPIKQPCILIFDSLAGASRTRVVATLRDYLRIECKVKGGKDRDFSKDTIRGASPKVPQQTNFTDCGLYLLQYVESFFQDPIKDYRLPMRALANWFPEEVVNRKREDLQKLLLSLMEKTGVDITSLNLPKLSFSSRSQESKGKALTSHSEDSEAPSQDGDYCPTETSAEEEPQSNIHGLEQKNNYDSSNAGSANTLSTSTNDSNCVISEKKISLVNYSDDSDEKNSMSVDSDSSSPTQTKKSNTLTYLKSKRIERHLNKDVDRTPPKKIRTDVSPNKDCR